MKLWCPMMRSNLGLGLGAHWLRQRTAPDSGVARVVVQGFPEPTAQLLAAGMFGILVVQSLIGLALHSLMKLIARRVIFWTDAFTDLSRGPEPNRTTDSFRSHHQGDPVSSIEPAMDPQLAVPRRASAIEMRVLDLGDRLAGGSIELLVAQFKAAFTNTGFLHVSNHGIPRAAVDAVFDGTRRYFSLSMEECLKTRSTSASVAASCPMA